MGKKNDHDSDEFDINLLDCKLLGRGHNGSVYQLPGNRVIKICLSEKNCRKEYEILRRVNGNKYFPKVYEYGRNYMIRECVFGDDLSDYIKKNGFNKGLARNLIRLLEEFKKLKFTKQDIRCRDILVQGDGKLKIIDPKGSYKKKRDNPRHLCKGLEKLGVLDKFFDVLKHENPKLYKKWHRDIEIYLQNRMIEGDQ